MRFTKKHVIPADSLAKGGLGLATEKELTRLVALKLQALLPELAAELVEQYFVNMRFGAQTNQKSHRFLLELQVTPKTEAEKTEEHLHTLKRKVRR